MLHINTVDYCIRAYNMYKSHRHLCKDYLSLVIILVQKLNDFSSTKYTWLTLLQKQKITHQSASSLRQ